MNRIEQVKKTKEYELEILIQNEKIDEIKIFLNRQSKEEIKELIDCDDYWDYTINWHFNPLKTAIKTENLKLIELLLKNGFKDMGRFRECGETIYESALFFCYCDSTDLSKVSLKEDILKLMLKYDAIEKDKHYYNFKDLIDYANELEKDEKEVVQERKNNKGFINENFKHEETKKNLWITINFIRKMNIFDIEEFKNEKYSKIRHHFNGSQLGIKTKGVKGINFRSMIEARWAYVLEKLNLNWEYEPFELKGYIPDFIITNNSKQVLLEIKADVNIWDNKNTDYEHKIKSSGWDKEYIILGGNIKKEYDLWVCGYGYLDGIHSKIYIKKTKDNNYIFVNNQLIDNNIPSDFIYDLWIDAKNNFQWKNNL